VFEDALQLGSPTREFPVPVPSITSLNDVAVNPRTNMAYMTDRTPLGRLGTVYAINMTSGNVSLIQINGSTTAVAVNQDTNVIYVSAIEPNKVLAINGTTNCFLAEIPVDNGPRDLAVDTTRNMLYVANMLSGTISAINSTTNTATAVVKLNIDPPNSGYIECNGERLRQNFTRYDVGTRIVCDATAYNGFKFSSWSGDLVPTIAFENHPNVTINAVELEVQRYGTLNANFIPSIPFSIPMEFLLPLYGIIPAVIVSTFIPSLLLHRKEKRESKRYQKYYTDQIGKLDKVILEKEITQLYKEGKIKELDYKSLVEEIKNFQDHESI
jgi:YVTN family beta-propeller protein